MATISQMGIVMTGLGILMPYRRYYESEEEYEVRCAALTLALDSDARAKINDVAYDIYFKRAANPNTPIPKLKRYEDESLLKFKLREMDHIKDYERLQQEARDRL